MNLKKDKINFEYEYGFSTDSKNDIQFSKGLSRQVVENISKLKDEPKWMLELRLKAYDKFVELKNPEWGPDLKEVDFDDYIYYSASDKQNKNKWEDVPEKIKDTFKKLKVDEAEAKFLSGVNNQFDSQVVYNNIQKELEELGVIFCNIEKALKICPDIVKQYFGKLVSYADNKYAALNTAVWSGGSFIYVPEDVLLKKPLQSYFRINTMSIGQFERTLIIVDKGAKLHYIEGCTAPIYDKNNLHAAIVEVFVMDNAKCRYTTIQNWSDNVINLVTKRCKVLRNGIMEWIDGNIGSKLNMKYPATILAGEYASAKCVSIAVAHKGVIHDAGAKMFHLAPNTKSQIISKSIAHGGGQSDYRGHVYISKEAKNSFSEITCDTLLLDGSSKSDTIPKETVLNKTSFLKHEASVSQLDKQKLFYLNSKGFDYETAKNLISLGFIDPFTKELPMEYAVELNRLIKNDFNE